jgi:uroporphyrinogen decarboxylase
MTTRKSETMTSRQRVLKAINHEPVDRVPIDLGMHYSTGISAFAYWNLREHLGLANDDIEIADMVQFLAKPQEDILKRFHVDCALLHPGWSETRTWNPRDKYRFNIPATARPVLDGEGAWHVEYNGRMRMPKNGFFFDGDWLGFEDRSEDAHLEAVSREAERIYKETDYFTSYLGFNGFFREADIEWQCRMLTDPDQIQEENKRILEAELKKAEKIIKRMARYIQAVCAGGDLGSQAGPLVRPSVYEQLSAPFLRKLCTFIHENSDLKIFYHCCGSIKPMIPILIDCGVDMLNPVQISANDMDPQELKDAFGGRMTFWGGGCDTQNVLGKESTSDVAQNVKKLMSIFKKNSGFVFNQVHNIMGDVRPENIVAMLDTAYEESFS